MDARVINEVIGDFLQKEAPSEAIQGRTKRLFDALGQSSKFSEFVEKILLQSDTPEPAFAAAIAIGYELRTRETAQDNPVADAEALAASV